ncbi:S-layer homology domain-containing protein [Paenibacillus sp. FSL H8-0537]|uniref:S-layer homology domain-containing protein n=1 Tax=Paenibacillus sp. FSL H8-0537 TaxID=2921399 RepID=UPI0031019008
MRTLLKQAPARHFLLLMLSCLLVLPAVLLPTAAHAASDAPAKITITNTNVTAGQSATVPVMLTDPGDGVGAYNMQIDFDPSVLSIVSITPTHGVVAPEDGAPSDTGYFQSNFDNTAGWARVIWIDSTGGNARINDPAQLFAIEVKSLSSETTGTYHLTVDTSNNEKWAIYRSSSYAIHSTLVGGDIVISKANSGSGSGSGSSGGGSATPTPSATPAPTSTPAPTTAPVIVYIDGKEQQYANAQTSVQNGRTTIQLEVDNDKVIQQIDTSGIKELRLPIPNSTAAVVNSGLNGQLVKELEKRGATVKIETPSASYTLPAGDINIDAISAQVGSTVKLSDIKIIITIAAADNATANAVQNQASQQGVALVGAPVNFEVIAQYNGQNISISQFNHYVERSITLPAGSDGSKMTTGVVLGEDGTLHHVPTYISVTGSTYFANINSLTNSSYAVVYAPASFKDVETHWSKNDVNDLGSRLIMKGVSSTEFAPNASITRAEFTATLLRALGIHKASGTTSVSFSDVKAGSWYENEVKLAVSNKLISGYSDGTFRPNGLITREEAMIILNRALALTTLATVKDAAEIDSLLAAYGDSASVSEYAKAAVASALKNGIVQGADGSLNPDSNVTRAETAAIVKRLLVKAGLING